MKWLQRIRPQRIASEAAAPKLYYYDRQQPGERSRLHLRIDADGSGLLLINASRIVHLNPSAALLAKLALDGQTPAEAVRELMRRYRVDRRQAEQDFRQVASQLEELARPDGACPLHDLELEIITPFSARPSAPYRMDLAITYRCNNDCSHCYNARPRDFAELPTSQWKVILDRLWEIGIPHVVFTGGEPTLRDDLAELIQHAQKNGQITGLNTNGRRLRDRRYLDSLVEAGLDHVQITLESHDAQIHDRMVNCRGAWNQTVAGIQNALDSSLFLMTNTTMLHHNAPLIGETLEFLATLGVPTVGLNALIYSGKGATCGAGLGEHELPPLLEMAKRITAAHNQRLIWYTPTQYCHFDPAALELGVKGCTAALYNMCIEPDGGVIPCQSYYYQLGNLLNDAWDSIWNHDLSIRLRERRNIAEKCHDCILLAECGGGCPLFRQALEE
ncbi:MAG: PqqD family peptide modification chaperone [Anaerolineales bacterium]|nr:PqqD family peptide modification chaperone [Anaerolineales bacterium]